MKKVAIFQNASTPGTAVEMTISEDPADGVLNLAGAAALAPTMLTDYGVPTLETDTLKVDFYDKVVTV